MRSAYLLLSVLLGHLSLAATTHDFQLEDLRLAGCKVAAGRVVLDRCFDQGAAPQLAMEAEVAVDVVADPPGGQAEPACSGGRCLVRVDRALLPLQITRAGRYTRWARGYFPQGGGWLHSESLDFGKQEWYTDCDGLTAGRWVWVKGPTYDLGAGTHLLWFHNWHGGALLDKVALLPEGAPEPTDQGPPAVALSPAKQGWVATGALSVPGLSRLLECRWPAEDRGGEVALSLSLDGGATYRAMGPEALAAAGGNPAARIVVRADVQAAADGTSPALAVPQVSYEIDGRAFVTLEDEQVQATFLRATGALIRLHDKLAHADCLTAAGTAPPFALRHLLAGSGKTETVPDEQVKLTELRVQGSAVTATYAVAGGLTVRVVANLTGSQVVWALTVNNQSKLDLVEAVCPRLPGLRMGRSSEDDFLMVPNWQGGIETRDPVRTGGDGVRYPTGGAMCWFDLYEKAPTAHGVYLSGHDPSLMGCALQAAADRDADALTFSLAKFARVRPGERWSAPPVVVGLHEGDWHAAADAYRTWAQTWMRRPAPPEWVREADGWYGAVVSADGSHVPFKQLPDFLKSARDLGTNYIQVWGQMTGGSNCDALPYPNPVLGSLDEFRAAVREIRRWGGHITFYVSSQFWRVDYGDEPLLGSTPRALLPPGVPTWPWDEWVNYALRGSDGSFAGDTELTAAQQARYHTHWLRTILCPATEAWSKRHLKYWCVDQYGKAYGASGIYLDETCAAGERVCYATNHGHQHPGIWGASLARTMQDLVSSGRRSDPDWTFAMEGCGDAIGQFADMNLISPASAKKPGMWGATRRFAPECFHYTFPDYLLYDGVANGMYGRSEEDCFLEVHLQGNRFDAFSVSPAAPYAKLRQRTKQLLYRARFMDTVRLTSDDPAVRAKVSVLHDAANDVQIINVANPERQGDATIDLKLKPGAALSGYYFDLEGHEGPVELTSTASGVTFAAPTSRASTVLVAARCEPLVRAPAATVAAGDKGAVEVSLTNVMPEATAVKLTLDKPLPGLARQPVQVTLPAQRTVSARLPLTAAAGLERRCYSGHLLVKAQDQTRQRPLDVLVVSPYEVSAALAGQGVQVRVRNHSQVAQSGRLAISGPLWDSSTTQPIRIEASGESTVMLPLARPLTDESAIRAQIQYGDQVDGWDLVVRPWVLNGGFETPGAGARPAGWNFQGPELASTDNDRPAAGKACLKLTGRPGVFVEADQLVPVVAGQTYAASCQMRRSAGEAARVQPAVVLFMKSGPEQYAYLEPRTKQPAAEWNEYFVRFTVPPDVARVAVYLYNVNSTATAWFDEVQVEPVSG
ncbi:MAG: carbohydrate binding domain-containing protein [Armatimonadetes bacterium]|nr:carbohydrate binding domain-containing protein [Armatimonadota bacterium]